MSVHALYDKGISTQYNRMVIIHVHYIRGSGSDTESKQNICQCNDCQISEEGNLSCL